MSHQTAFIAAALCATAALGGCGPSWDALDPSLGAGGAPHGGAGGGGDCTAPEDCPGADAACAARSCEANACGIHLVEAREPCAEDGGAMCDGKGSCVQCLTNGDCGTSTACTVYTCNAGVCPATPDLAAGTPCGSGAVCDGAGTCVTCQSPTEVTIASTDVPKTAAFDNGMATSNLNLAGAVGIINHVTVTVNVDGAQAQSGNLSLLLSSPSGTTVDLSSKNGGASTNNFAGTTFDDAAPPPAVRVLYATFAPNVTLASAIPERNLSRLNGESPNGTWQLRVVNAGTSGDATLNAWSLQITTQQGNPPTPKATFASTKSLSIPHNGKASSTLVVSGVTPALYAATVTVEAPHPKSGQLVISLRSPSGKSIPLVKNIGGNTANVFASTTFDDAAPLLLGCSGAGCASANGPIATVVPQGSLSSLVGDDPNGTWTLEVADSGTGPTGALEGWSLSLTPALCSMAP